MHIPALNAWEMIPEMAGRELPLLVAQAFWQ